MKSRDLNALIEEIGNAKGTAELSADVAKVLIGIADGLKNGVSVEMTVDSLIKAADVHKELALTCRTFLATIESKCSQEEIH